MPIFMIERNFAERLEMTPEGAAAINEINDEESVRWLISFLSVDNKKTFCLYEASSADSIREAARRAGILADEIIEVAEEIVPVEPQTHCEWAGMNNLFPIDQTSQESRINFPNRKH